MRYNECDNGFELFEKTECIPDDRDVVIAKSDDETIEVSLGRDGDKYYIKFENEDMVDHFAVSEPGKLRKGYEEIVAFDDFWAETDGKGN